jgi:hypothetical protein
VKAKESLSGEKPLPRIINEKGFEISAKGSQFDWDTPYQRMWDEVSKAYVCASVLL